MLCSKFDITQKLHTKAFARKILCSSMYFIFLNGFEFSQNGCELWTCLNDFMRYVDYIMFKTYTINDFLNGPQLFSINRKLVSSTEIALFSKTVPPTKGKSRNNINAQPLSSELS